MPQGDQDWQSSQDTQLLESLATKAALSYNWDEAAKINERILKYAQDNVAALNRLARALACLGEINKAQRLYKKVLEIDPYNIIAKKNVEKLSKTSEAFLKSNRNHNFHPQTGNLSNLFVFEPGKTKIISLINPAPPTVLATLAGGDQLFLNPKNHGITILSQNGVYLGALPDDLAHRLITFISGGNKYEVYVKSSTIKSVTVFIKEVERSSKFTNQPSFQNSSNPYLEEVVF